MVVIEMPIWLGNLMSVLFGLVVGSFMNVVVARVPHHKSVVSPRSQCPRCQSLIRWYDNLPVLSYLLLRGKCRHCGEAISVRYPVIELLTALLFLAAKIRFGLSLELLVRDWPFLAMLVAITFIDLEHRIIPDVLSLGGLVLGLVTCWMTPHPGWELSIAGAAVGFGMFYALAWIYERKTGRAGLGGGDIKLLAMLGAFVGPTGVFMTILVSSVFGSIAGVGWALATRRKNLMKVSIPYGPFLVVGALYYYLMALE